MDLNQVLRALRVARRDQEIRIEEEQGYVDLLHRTYGMNTTVAYFTEGPQVKVKFHTEVVKGLDEAIRIVEEKANNE